MTFFKDLFKRKVELAKIQIINSQEYLRAAQQQIDKIKNSSAADLMLDELEKLIKKTNNLSYRAGQDNMKRLLVNNFSEPKDDFILLESEISRCLLELKEMFRDLENYKCH